MRHVFVSGNAALDFVGTLKWRRSTPEELLTTAGDLDSWIAEAGLLDTDPHSTAADLAAAVRLREAAYDLVRARAAGHRTPAKAAAVVNEFASAPTVLVQLIKGRMSRQGSVVNALTEIARAAILVAGDHDLVVKECGREECTRIYVDHSRGARRAWCGMDECGNRVKAANYRARQRASAGR